MLLLIGYLFIYFLLLIMFIHLLISFTLFFKTAISHTVVYLTYCCPHFSKSLVTNDASEFPENIHFYHWILLNNFAQSILFLKIFFLFTAACRSSWSLGLNWCCSCWPAPQIQMWDLSHIWDIGHSLWQCQILNPLSKIRDQTSFLMNSMLGS